MSRRAQVSGGALWRQTEDPEPIVPRRTTLSGPAGDGATPAFPTCSVKATGSCWYLFTPNITLRKTRNTHLSTGHHSRLRNAFTNAALTPRRLLASISQMGP